MSRRNKVNPDHYTGAGRLAPDDLARERRKQSEQLSGGMRERQRKPTPPWMANDADTVTGGGEQPAVADTAQAEAVEAEDAPAPNTDVSEPAARPPETPRASEVRKPRPGAKPAGVKAKAKAKAKPKAKAKAKAKAKVTTLKAATARGTSKSRKAAKGRSSAARKASSQRTGRRLAAATKTRRAGPPKKARKGAKAAKKAKKR